MDRSTVGGVIVLVGVLALIVLGLCLFLLSWSTFHDVGPESLYKEGAAWSAAIAVVAFYLDDVLLSLRRTARAAERMEEHLRGS